MENRIEDAGCIQTAISAHQNLSYLPNLDDDNNDNSSSQNKSKNNSLLIDNNIISESSLKNHDQNYHQNLKDTLSTQNIKPENISSDLINQRKIPSETDPEPRGLGKRCQSTDSLLKKRCESTESLRSIDSLHSVDSLRSIEKVRGLSHRSDSTDSLLSLDKSRGLRKRCDSTDSLLSVESCESGTHSDASQLKSGVKRNKRHKTKSPKDTNEKQLLKKKTSSKTQIKSKFATGSIEYIQQNLGGKIFSGWIEERRWIDSIGGYRDVVQVDECEMEINRQIKAITNSIPGVAEGTKWINITGPSESEPCCCLWVLMPAAPTPGHCWFQVTNILIEPLFGLRIHVKMIRNLHTHDGETMDARKRRRELLAKQGTPEAVAQSFSQQVELWVDQIRSTDMKALLASVAKTITFHNIKESIRFIIVLLVTIVVGLVHFSKEAWFFSVRFMQEAGVFMRNITPFLQSLLKFVEKLIGGFYVLIAMVYRDMRHGPPPPKFPPNGPPPVAYVGGGPHGPPQLALPPGTQPHYIPPGKYPEYMTAANVAQQRSVPQYVPADNWVYRRQNAAEATENS